MERYPLRLEPVFLEKIWGGTSLAGIFPDKGVPAGRPIGESWELTAHGNEIHSVALDPSGQIAITGNAKGVVHVGPVSGATPHLLLGHDGIVWALRVTPDGRWVVSAGNDGTVRLWPMPRDRPFHTLPHDEFLERLRALTNLRVVRDSGSTTRYDLEMAAFPGWDRAPSW